MPSTFRTTLLPALVLVATATADQCPIGFAPISNSTSGQGSSSGTTQNAIKWIDCPTEKSPRLQCGLLTVPIDYTDLSLGNLEMPVVRVPAISSNSLNQSIIVNFGGPGGSGIKSFVGGKGDEIQGDVGEDWDLVSFDPRGVGLNEVYVCPDNVAVAVLNTVDGADDAGEIDISLVQNNSSAAPDSPEWFQERFDLYRAAADYCADPTYTLAGQLVGSAFVARDVNHLAQLTNQDGLIRFYGQSFASGLFERLLTVFCRIFVRHTLGVHNQCHVP